jgi:flagellar hook protein FlgE
MNRWLAVLMVCCGCGEDQIPTCERMGVEASWRYPIVDSDSPLDLALEGPGFFALSDGATVLYTRLGHFTFDADGFLSGPGNFRVLGFIDGNSTVGPFSISEARIEAASTSQVTIRANLKASDPLQSFDPEDPSATTSSTYSSTLTVYDGLGKAHTVDVYWSHAGERIWQFHAMTDGANVADGTPGAPSEIAAGALAFDTDGKLSSLAQETHFWPSGATRPQPLSFDLGDPTETGGTGLGGVTQFDASGSTSFVDQDGHGFGQLAQIRIDSDGRIRGVFTNGLSRQVGSAAIAVALFPSPQALRPVAHHLMLATVLSGEPRVALPSHDGRGWVISNALEALPDDTNRCLK